jgi:hypothetical protein
MDPRSEGAKELLLAVFRLAVADYLGISYSHDGNGPTRRVRLRSRSEARSFLASSWANCLADMAGFSASAVWREARTVEKTERSWHGQQLSARAA